MITLTLARDGQIRAVHLDNPVGDAALDKAAWNAIIGTTYSPLPDGTQEQTFKLRIHFRVE